MRRGWVRERDRREEAGQMFSECACFGVEERAGLSEAVEHKDFKGGGGGGGWGGVGRGHCGAGRRKRRRIAEVIVVREEVT